MYTIFFSYKSIFSCSVCQVTSTPLPLHYFSVMTDYNSLEKMALKGVSILSNATIIIFKDLNQKYGFRSHLHISLDCCFGNLFWNQTSESERNKLLCCHFFINLILLELCQLFLKVISYNDWLVSYRFLKLFKYSYTPKSFKY